MQKILIALIVLATAAMLVVLYLMVPYPAGFLSVTDPSVKVFDRRHELLMEITGNNGGFSDPMELKSLPSRFKDMLLYSEDRAFYSHAGIRPAAMARAVLKNFAKGRFVSGGSTLTQQLVKMKYGIARNNPFTKFLELFRAFKMELHFEKNEILASYVNNIFLGNRIYGLKKAAEVYYRKDPSQLNLLETASFIVMIQSPSRFDPYHDLASLEKQTRIFLGRVYNDGLITKDEYSLSLEQKFTVYPFDMDIHAPHFCFYALENAKSLVPAGSRIAEIDTTLDLELYRAFIDILKNRLEFLKRNNAHDAALLLIDNASMEIRVMIGGLDYFGENGQINGCEILRQPASTMKAFTYALAFETKKLTPASVLPDIYTEFPSSVGKYVPRNFNEMFHGPVRAAVALGSSFNVPAVYVLEKIGLGAYYRFLKQVGFPSIDRPASYYGLGLTLGNADITLSELVQAYTIFPNAGTVKDATGIVSVRTTDGKIYGPEKAAGKKVLSAETAFLISHILSDYKYKAPGFGVNSPVNFPFPLAVKTGTSKDFRDNFIIAFDQSMTVGIWTGNLNGEPMRNLPSAAGSGILLRDVAEYLYKNGHAFEQNSPYGLNVRLEKICRLSGMFAGPECEQDLEYFLIGTVPEEPCTWHRNGTTVLPPEFGPWAKENLQKYLIQSPETIKIIHPVDGDIFRIEKNVPIQNQQIEFSVHSADGDVNWFLDGKTFGKGSKLHWTLVPGEHRISAVDRSGKADTVLITVVE